MTEIFRASTSKFEQSRTRRLRHHHDCIGRANDGFEHEALVGSRVFKHRVRDDDRRPLNSFQDRDDRIAVGSVVDPVLCWTMTTSARLRASMASIISSPSWLFNSAITILAGGSPSAPTRTIPTSSPYSYSPPGERCGERRNTALGWRIRRDHRVGTRSMIGHWLLFTTGNPLLE